MPSQFPSSFASAAAGNNREEGGTGGRGSIRVDGGGTSADWSRRGPNGSATFRRPSLSTTLSHQQNTQNQTSNSTGTSGVYVPPHAYTGAGRNGGASESRYSKDELLSIFRTQKESGELDKNLSNLMVGDWSPGMADGARNGSWNKMDEDANGTGPDLCWEQNGKLEPLGLDPMTAEEKDAFSGSVNSPIKPPPQNIKESGAQSSGNLGRRTSMTLGQINSSAFGLSSPTSSRPGNRRRETGDSVPYPSNTLSSPTGTGRFFGGEPNTQTPPPSLLRRRTENKDGIFGTGSHEDKEASARDNTLEITSPFSSMLRRNATGPSSPWSAGSQTTGLSPMGAFGSFTLAGPSGQPATPGEKKTGFGSLRGESRFSKLMSKDSSEELSGDLKEKSSVASLGKLSEAETEHPQGNRTGDGQFSRPVSSSTDPFGDEIGPGGSAALGGGQDQGPTHRPNAPGLGTPTRQTPRNDFGFSSLAEPSGMGGLRELNMQQRRDQLQHQVPQSQHHSAAGDNEPLSPTETNPYQSPVPERADSDDIDTDELGFQNIHHPGIGGMLSNQGMVGYGSQTRNAPASGLDGAGSDRSQTSSAGAPKGFGLGGLGNLSSLGNWPSSSAPGGPGLVGTPQRERSSFGAPFGNSGFSGLGDLQSPGSNNLGGLFSASNATVPSTTGTAGRTRRLASLFPPAMQAQMQTPGDAARPSEDDALIEGGQGVTSHSRGIVRKDTDSPLRTGKGIFDELYPSDNGRTGVDGFDNGHSERDHTVPGSSQTFTSGSIQAPMSATVVQGGLPHQNSHQTKNVTQPSQQAQTTQSSTPGAPPGQFQQQERTMVMPDRMRWLYKDFSGAMQGPFSGLEMHDWFKAGFFTPDLQVKKVEDNDYKPLGQIIRQIGNSREPFLVPQMGIAYGPPSNQDNGQWGSGGAAAASSNQPSQSGTVQPPFAGSFPSFGTTLTAEQQNNLERRKQEEQYLMARQREHLVQQQVIQKQVDAARMHALHGVHPVQQLHHHGSAHSLHSQPSFGSMTSPGGFQPTPPTMPAQMPHSVVPAFFDINAPLRPAAPGVLGAMGPGPGPSPEYINGTPMRDEEMSAMMSRMNFNRDIQLPFVPVPGSIPPQSQENQAHSQQVAAILAQRAQLSREQAQHDALQQQSGATEQALQTNERLQQFHDLRAQIDEENSQHPTDRAFRHPFGTPGHQKADPPQGYTPSHRVGLQAQELIAKAQLPSPPAVDEYPLPKDPVEGQNVVQQTQHAAAAKQPSAPITQQETVWSKVDGSASALPQPFPPPPQSISPLPAPTAQKSRQTLPEALNLEARSGTQTPSVEIPSATASVAPWAREATEGAKGPSLKEIQEAEARKAAKAEEAAAAARRAQLQLELANQPQPPVPGLPPTSTWGTSPGATPPSSAPSAWNKPLGKGNAAQGSAGMKKSLSQIQKEEEAFARKQRAATASAANAANAIAAPISAGKRYADLASKPAQGPAQGPGGAWTTVGAGGKTKGPLGGSAAAVQPQRTTSSGPAPAFTPTAKLRPVVTPVRSSTLGGALPGQPSANDEFTKWAKGALSKGLNKTINVDDFLQQLLAFPQENDLISECIYANSQTMDGRRFAEEFIRRQKLADRGISEGSASIKGPTAGETKNGGGWSEVAKKGPVNGTKETEPTSAFKVVEPKKKGKK
ncbi:MAG: hypothetical protein M1813_004606 [Trichoglossum hirsutum]|nr:MAG: hypothetical protein M1813_004606 [Trichoglossum hirsutum]